MFRIYFSHSCRFPLPPFLPFPSPFTEPYVDLNGLYRRGFVRVLGAATVGSEPHKHASLPDDGTGASGRGSP